jgi:hypothetical protein
MPEFTPRYPFLVAINYVKADGVNGTFEGTFYGRHAGEANTQAREFVNTYIRPSFITDVAAVATAEL